MQSPVVTDRAVCFLLKASVKTLRRLTVDAPFQLSSELLRDVLACSALTSLELHTSSQVALATMYDVKPDGLPALRSLKCGALPTFRGSINCLEALMQAAPNLTAFGVRAEVDNAWVLKALRRYPRLQSLELRVPGLVLDRALCQQLSELNALEHLEMRRMTRANHKDPTFVLPGLLSLALDVTITAKVVANCPAVRTFTSWHSRALGGDEHGLAKAALWNSLTVLSLHDISTAYDFLVTLTNVWRRERDSFPALRKLQLPRGLTVQSNHAVLLEQVAELRPGLVVEWF